MELKKYLFPLWKWWWLVAASTLVAAIFSLMAVLRQPTVYQARATLMIGTTINDPNPSSTEIQLGQQLAAAYADIANRETVRNATMRALNMDRLPQYNVRALPNTLLIDITVTDTDPERARNVVNEIANQMILLSPTGTKPEEAGRQEFINQQLSNLEVQIKETEAEIGRLQDELITVISAQKINETKDQIAALQSKLDTMQEKYTTLLSNTHQGATNTLTIIESASLAANPIGPRKGFTVLLAVVFAFALAAGEAYLLEYLNDTLRSADEVERIFTAPIIGHIFEQNDAKGEPRLYDTSALHHLMAESFRSLRTKIELYEGDKPFKTILVTSPDIGDGKTSVAANLALFISQRMKKVILVDADFRKPNIHNFFDLSNDRGLADFFQSRATIQDVIRYEKDRKVAVITTGKMPPNPTELLSSKKMDQLLAALEEIADVVIIDSPPFIVTDAMVMASKVDGVLMVVRPGHTRQSLARSAIEQMKIAEARLIGVVLNRIPLRGAQYYGGQSHPYIYYHLNNDGIEQRGSRLKIFRKEMGETASSNGTNGSGGFKRLFKSIFKLSSK